MASDMVSNYLAKLGWLKETLPQTVPLVLGLATLHSPLQAEMQSVRLKMPFGERHCKALERLSRLAETQRRVHISKTIGAARFVVSGATRK